MAGEGGLLDIGYGMDPLTVLGEELRDTPLDPDSVTLVQTEGVQQDLAVVAPWLKNREPFILVRTVGHIVDDSHIAPRSGGVTLPSCPPGSGWP